MNKQAYFRGLLKVAALPYIPWSVPTIGQQQVAPVQPTKQQQQPPKRNLKIRLPGSAGNVQVPVPASVPQAIEDLKQTGTPGIEYKGPGVEVKVPGGTVKKLLNGLRFGR